jgi:hypothetical protein
MKFKKHYQHYTPAMTIGLTQTALTWRYLLTTPIPTIRGFFRPALICRDYPQKKGNQSNDVIGWRHVCLGLAHW